MFENIKNSRTFKRFRKNKTSIFGIGIILFFALVAILAPFISKPVSNNPYQIPQHGYSLEPRPPDSSLIFGTTEQQYDLFYGIVWGARTAFKIGAMVVAASLIAGIILGGIAGFYGGWVDEIIMRFTDIVFAFPGIVLAVVIAAMLGPGIEKAAVAIAAVSWPSYARLLRGDVLTVKRLDFVLASKSFGAGDFWIFRKHILPNSIFPVIIVASLDIGSIVLTAAALSFLGLGSPAGYADWGQLIAMSRNWILGSGGNPFAYWHTLFIPGAAIFLFVLGWNLTGDAFRDVLDPRQQ
ncbi:MAG: ABC transporter permease [Elusimicrobia bacterium]|nr:ABC transporter permease [Elusimicrobiota bacterium]